MAKSNTRVVVAKYPTEFPVVGEHLVVETVPFDVDAVHLSSGELLLKNLVLSLDPYMRARLHSPDVESFASGIALGDVPDGYGISEVIKSANSNFKVGDWVYGMTGWEQYTRVPASSASGLRVSNHIKHSGLPVTYYVGVLGMPGLTAYIGLFKYAQPLKKGETLFVSAASGAVGQVVGQIGKLQGLRVVGSAGEDAKVDYLLKECGFDAAFNYKKHDTGEKFKELCPDGIDIDFENVGGKTLEHVLDHAKTFGRIIVCGMVSQYNLSQPEPIHNIINIFAKRLKVDGFLVWDSEAEYADRFNRDMEKWLKEGKIIYKEDVVHGIENLPDAFLGMLKGKNFGKQVVKLFDV